MGGFANRRSKNGPKSTFLTRSDAGGVYQSGLYGKRGPKWVQKGGGTPPNRAKMAINRGSHRLLSRKSIKNRGPRGGTPPQKIAPTPVGGSKMRVLGAKTGLKGPILMENRSDSCRGV